MARQRQANVKLTCCDSQMPHASKHRYESYLCLLAWMNIGLLPTSIANRIISLHMFQQSCIRLPASPYEGRRYYFPVVQRFQPRNGRADRIISLHMFQRSCIRLPASPRTKDGDIFRLCKGFNAATVVHIIPSSFVRGLAGRRMHDR